ncbi:MAG: hypothetical protein HY744_08705 [Deltaproteobacteria bacterium]|nr:hypothetical protein [Deltaproteobacteria bacterium]
MDIGVYWSAALLAHKLERREQRGCVQEVWNVRHCPKGMGESADGNRFVVASQGRWRGYFRLLPEVLFNPRDPACPYALIFDAKSWTPIAQSIPCRPFRGWTYQVPTKQLVPNAADPRHAADATELARQAGHDLAAGPRTRTARRGSRSPQSVDHS